MRSVRRWMTAAVAAVLLTGVIAPQGAEARNPKKPGILVTELLGPDGEPLFMAKELNSRGQVLAYTSQRPGNPTNSVVWERGTATIIEPTSRGPRVALAISDRGQVVGNGLVPGQGIPIPVPRLAFSWSAGEITDLTPAQSSSVGAVNNRGQVLATIVDYTSNTRELVIWQDGEITATVDASSELQLPRDINDRGLAIANTTTFEEPTAWAWQAGGELTSLGTLGGDWSLGQALNNRGQVVGQSETAAGDDRVFLWRNGQMTDLGTLGGTWSRVGLSTEGPHLGLVLEELAFGGGIPIAPSGRNAVNEWGHVVGTSQTAAGDEHAFLWRNGQMTDLGTLGGSWSRAYAVNNWGQVVGVSETASGEIHAFVWQRGRMTDLGTLGEEASYALDINDRGQIVGSVGIRMEDLQDLPDDPNDLRAFRAVMWTVRPFG